MWKKNEIFNYVFYIFVTFAKIMGKHIVENLSLNLNNKYSQ